MKKNLLSFLFVCASMLPIVASATNGYWAHGYGPKSKSIAGACVAMAFDSICAAGNPAALVLAGSRMAVGAALMSPKRRFDANGDAQTPPYASIPPARYESKNELFLIPHVSYNKMLDERSSVGVSIGGNGGMNTEYDSAIFQNFANPSTPSTMPSSPTGIDMAQLFAGITYSRKVGDDQSFGITPIFAVQNFEAKGLQPFTPYSAYPDKVTNNGKDYSYGGGLRLGWLWRVNDRLNLGIAYQSEMVMTDFDKYKGLFADAGGFNIPQNYDLGFSYKLDPKVVLAFTYQHIDYASIKALGNASDIVFSSPENKMLGTKDGLGYGWADMDILKFGIRWQFKPDLVFRAGYSHANDIVSGSQALFNTLSPAVVKEHYTFGIGKNVSKKSSVNMAFMYAPDNKVEGTNPNTGPQTGSIKMKQREVEVGWELRF
jgi:long-chain fatty acid transport protein